MNIKTFSEILDIDTHLSVCVRLRPICGNGVPGAKICLDGDVWFDGELSEPITICGHINLTGGFAISVEMKDKVYDQHRETAVIIESIAVQDIELIPDYTRFATYTNDLDQSTVATHYLGWNGIWCIASNDPFLIWLHRAQNRGDLLVP